MTMALSRRGMSLSVVTILLTLISSAAACDRVPWLEHAFNGVRLLPALAKPNVVWHRSDGSSFNFAQETAGRVTLLYFGYTHCPDVCPVQLMNLATALRSLGADTTEKVRVLFVTLDPARDTAAVLRNWLRGFHPEFIALRGSSASVNDEVKRLKLTPASLQDSSASAIGPAHASAVVAFGRDGFAHFIYPQSTSPAQWKYDLRKLLRDSVP